MQKTLQARSFFIILNTYDHKFTKLCISDDFHEKMYMLSKRKLIDFTNLFYSEANIENGPGYLINGSIKIYWTNHFGFFLISIITIKMMGTPC